MSGDWLSDSRSQVAADRILDAAADLFATRDIADVGMAEIAKASGCSRATLYRYFENRDALHTAYVRRETHRLNTLLVERIGGIDDPAERLVVGVQSAVEIVRATPALASWFANAPIGGEIAENDDVIHALVVAFVASLTDGDRALAERRARWLVRVMTSLLTFPAGSEADERAMLEEFVVPTVLPTSVAPGRSTRR